MQRECSTLPRVLPRSQSLRTLPDPATHSECQLSSLNGSLKAFGIPARLVYHFQAMAMAGKRDAIDFRRVRNEIKEGGAEPTLANASPGQLKQQLLRARIHFSRPRAMDGCIRERETLSCAGRSWPPIPSYKQQVPVSCQHWGKSSFLSLSALLSNLPDET